MIMPISNINFKGTVGYIDKRAAADSISRMPREYQNALIDGLNNVKTTIENGTTDDADFVLDVYDYKQYDKKLNEYIGVVVGIGNREDQPKYKGLPPKYLYAEAIDMSENRYYDDVHENIRNVMTEIKEEAYYAHDKEGFEKFKSFFTRKRPKAVNTDGTKRDIFRKLV